VDISLNTLHFTNKEWLSFCFKYTLQYNVEREVIHFEISKTLIMSMEIKLVYHILWRVSF